MREASITIDINKLIDNYQFNEKLVKKMYNNDYKQLALDLAKENQKLAFKSLKKESIIKEVRELLESKKHCERLFGGVEGETFIEQALEILDKGE